MYKVVYEAACKGCRDASQRAKMADLLRRYGDVCSKDSGDIGRTSLVEHSIPVMERTRPIRQPPHRLGPHKEAEAERQVQELLKEGLIEPSTGAWSSPVVLVRKEGQLVEILHRLPPFKCGHSTGCVSDPSDRRELGRFGRQPTFQHS